MIKSLISWIKSLFSKKEEVQEEVTSRSITTTTEVAITRKVKEKNTIT
jgi:putative effector of murein hydrolase